MEDTLSKIEDFRCKYLDIDKRHFSLEDIKEILDIVKDELAFMVRNNIPPLPKLYEKWFNVFCYLHEINKKLDDLEIKGLYKSLYGDSAEANKLEDGKLKENLKKVAESIEATLEKAVQQIDIYDKKLEEHTTNIEQTSKEILTEELLPSLEAILKELQEIRKQNETLKKELEKYHEEVSRLKEELAEAKSEAEIDFLTTIPNRRSFMRALQDAVRDFEMRNYPFSLIILDIDNFKQINDKYGHIVGDEVLKEIGSVLRNYLRANTIVGRIGGEEFAILLPGVPLEDAKKVAERIRKVIENRVIRIDENTEINLTASFGVTQVKKGDTVESVIDRADMAMYEAKRKGKNRVEVK